MTWIIHDARLLFYDGPVAVALSGDNPAQILQAFDRLRKLVVLAADQLAAESATPCTANLTDPVLPESCLSGKPPEKRKID